MTSSSSSFNDDPFVMRGMPGFVAYARDLAQVDHHFDKAKELARYSSLLLWNINSDVIVDEISKPLCQRLQDVGESRAWLVKRSSFLNDVGRNRPLPNKQWFEDLVKRLAIDGNVYRMV
jgi:hypothetical protein